jgi:hypothetical protein
MTTTQRAMHFREKPNDPVSPDFRPGLFVMGDKTDGGSASLE